MGLPRSRPLPLVLLTCVLGALSTAGSCVDGVTPDCAAPNAQCGPTAPDAAADATVTVPVDAGTTADAGNAADAADAGKTDAQDAAGGG